jgi:hypothetical protein
LFFWLFWFFWVFLLLRWCVVFFAAVQAQFDEHVLKLPDLKCFAAVQRHGLITDKAALVQHGLRLMGACGRGCR